MNNMSNLGIAILTIIATAGLLGGCSGGSAQRTEPQQKMAPPVAGPLGLPGPEELAAAITQPREVSTAVITRTGSENLPGYGQLIAAEDTDLWFTPDYSEGQSGLDGAAYAIYRFNLQGVELTDELSISWTTPPEDYADLWLGLSRWGANKWEWHPGPAGGKLGLSTNARFLYSNPPSGGDLYVVVLVTGTAEAVLEQLELDGRSNPDAQLVADPMSGAPPLTVSFDASGSSSPAGDIVQYEFDFGEGDGFQDNGTNPTSSYEYPEGDFTARVRVTDELDGTDEVSISITSAVLWPMFRHDSLHTGRSPFTGAQTNNLKWSFSTADMVERSSPAIGVDGTVYLGSRDSKLYAINPGGSLKWAYTTGGQVWSSPAIGPDGTVYVGSDDKKLHAINPDGSQKWSYETGGLVHRSSPTIGADETVFVGSWDHKLYAINPDGSLKWTYTTGDRVGSSPAIDEDDTVYVGSWDNKLYAINPDGSLKWAFTTGGAVWSSPAISANGTIYVGSDDHNLYAINQDGNQVWAYTAGDRVISSPAIGVDGTIYVGSVDNNLYALTPDRSLKWLYPMGADTNSSPAIGADGTIYVGSDKIYALNPDGSLKWSYESGGWVRSSPAIGADGTVYVGCDDHKLYAIGE